MEVIRQRLDIDVMQLGFMSGCGTANAIFILVTYKRNNKKNFILCISRFRGSFQSSADVARWALRKLGVEEWLFKISMYRNAQSRGRASGTFSNDFLVQVVLHQDSVLSF